MSIYFAMNYSTDIVENIKFIRLIFINLNIIFKEFCIQETNIILRMFEKKILFATKT